MMSLCKFPDFNLCFWAKNWVEMRPKISASDFRNSADRARHAIASSMRTRHSRFSLPRVRVVHASASLVLFQSARSREPCDHVTLISSISRGHCPVSVNKRSLGVLLFFSSSLFPFAFFSSNWYTRYNEVYWLEVGMDLAKGLRVLKRDSDVVKMCDATLKNKNRIHFYFEHLVNAEQNQEEQHESLPQYEEQWQEGDEPMLSKGGNDEQLQNNGSIEVLSNPSQAATTISNESPNLGDNNDTQVKSQERQSNPEEVDDRRRRQAAAAAAPAGCRSLYRQESRPILLQRRRRPSPAPPAPISTVSVGSDDYGDTGLFCFLFFARAARDEARRVPLLAACLNFPPLCSALLRYTFSSAASPSPHQEDPALSSTPLSRLECIASFKIFQGFHRANWSFCAAGSDVVSMKCKADRVDGGYVLNGNKMWCTNGPVAQTLLGQAITAFIIEKGMPGFSTTQKLDKLGMRGSDTCELVFENCFAPKENVLGEESMSCMSGLVLERLVLAAGPLGIMQACLDVVLPYVRQREQFGRPIGEFQFIQLAWKQDNIFHFRAYVYSVARDCDNGKVNAKDCAGIILTAAERQPKLLCSSLQNLQATQCLGGNGYVNEYPTGRLLRDAKLYEIGAGTSEIRRMIIGLELFKEQ
ncbi:Isovaleryl-CoA dehydrogenase [Arachis hypogaea]|nr:Isovaleryl-CoA dehydrogenase [Arachis hypogaea]